MRSTDPAPVHPATPVRRDKAYILRCGAICCDPEGDAPTLRLHITAPLYWFRGGSRGSRSQRGILRVYPGREILVAQVDLGGRSWGGGSQGGDTREGDPGEGDPGARDPGEGDSRVGDPRDAGSRSRSSDTYRRWCRPRESWNPIPQPPTKNYISQAQNSLPISRSLVHVKISPDIRNRVSPRGSGPLTESWISRQVRVCHQRSIRFSEELHFPQSL